MIIPAHFNFTTLNVLAANGSSPTGHCSSVRLNFDGTSTCLTPTSSVLFDGVIPTLTALDENMRASQLMILSLSEYGYSYSLELDFALPSYNMRVEITIFNCPQWGAGERCINLLSLIPYLRVITIQYTQLFFLAIHYWEYFQSIHLWHVYAYTLLQRDAKTWCTLLKWLYENNSSCSPFTTISGNWSAPESQGTYITKLDPCRDGGVPCVWTTPPFTLQIIFDVCCAFDK